MNFYSYLWLREDGTPYYAGKGSGNRAFRRHAHNRGLQPPADKSLILIFPHVSEDEAFESEKDFIKWFGRKDIGTGCLRNLTDGGENPPNALGMKRSAAFVQKMRKRSPTIQTIESKEKNRLAHLGRKHTIESKKKQSVGIKRTLLDPETRNKYRHFGDTNHFFGRRHTAETKSKISAAKRGVSHNL
jgi:NUMOD3 motif